MRPDATVTTASGLTKAVVLLDALDHGGALAGLQHVVYESVLLGLESREEAVALDVLQKKKRPHLTVITPAVWDNTTDAGVAAIPVSAFYESAPPTSFVRFCFSKRDAVLDGAAERLARWVERRERAIA